MSSLEWDKSTTSLSFAGVGMTSFNISTLLALCSCYGLPITLLWGFQNNKVRWHVRGSWSVASCEIQLCRLMGQQPQ